MVEINVENKEKELDLERAVKGIKLLLKHFPIVIVENSKYTIAVERQKKDNKICCKIHSIDTSSKEVPIDCISKILNDDIDIRFVEKAQQSFTEVFGKANVHF